MKAQAKKLAGALIALSGFVPNLTYVSTAHAQMTANTTLDMSASVVNPLAVTPSVSVSLDFGLFGIKGTGSYVVKATSATINNGFTISGNNVGTGKISAPVNAVLTMSILTQKAGTDIILKHTTAGGGTPNKEITVKSVYIANKSGFSNIAGTMKVGSPAITNFKVTNPASTGRFYMGAKLIFGVNQLLGTYSGQFTLRLTL